LKLPPLPVLISSVVLAISVFSLWNSWTASRAGSNNSAYVPDLPGRA
jgi:hypothetical protein